MHEINNYFYNLEILAFLICCLTSFPHKKLAVLMGEQSIFLQSSNFQGKDLRILASLSIFCFSSEKDAYPRFVVQFHNADNFILDQRVKQPTDTKIFASQMFIFKTPVQDEVTSNHERISKTYLILNITGFNT